MADVEFVPIYKKTSLKALMATESVRDAPVATKGDDATKGPRERFSPRKGYAAAAIAIGTQIRRGIPSRQVARRLINVIGQALNRAQQQDRPNYQRVARRIERLADVGSQDVWLQNANTLIRQLQGLARKGISLTNSESRKYQVNTSLYMANKGVAPRGNQLYRFKFGGEIYEFTGKYVDARKEAIAFARLSGFAGPSIHLVG